MISISEISKSFNRKPALDNVSMEIRQGEIFGLLGPNGAGKTTLIRIINQILEAERGTIRFQGKLLNNSHLANMGYLPEERGLYKEMNVIDQLVFFGRLRGLTTKEAEKNALYWLEKWQITDWKKRKIEQLSKGMAQKIQFIASVVHDPDFLILDEPLSGFDPVNVELMINELKALKEQGKTIMLSTHNMKSVEEICDRAALIHASKKLAEDSIWNLRESRKTGEFQIRFKGNMVSFANALWTDFELVEKQEIGDMRFLATVKMRHGNKMNDLLQALMKHIEIEAVEERFPSMQEVFIQLIQEPKMETNEK
ncbi:MAG: hypothetical protein RL264_2610 [Bacteroidota bacterium]|jgi:ABC-2 type transport system ATP-binding protein